MTTTDETKLREMLDERGIPWRETISGHTGWETKYGDDATIFGADAGLVLLHAWVTPEQAIIATLGDVDLATKNAELREFATETWELLTCNEPVFVWSDLQEKARELGVELE